MRANCKARAPARAPPLEDLPAVGCRHAMTEAVLPHSLPFLGLPRSLHELSHSVRY
jgi:hypothetical protein